MKYKSLSSMIVLLSLLVLTFGATPTPVAASAVPDGLSTADWAQIKPMLPALLLPGGQQAYLKASNTGLNDWFGISVAVDGNTAVVGAIGEGSNATGVNGNQTDDSIPRAGAVYVFVRNGNTWSQQAYLKSAAPDGDDYFGYSVEISGDTIVVGVPNEDSNATGINGNATDDSAGNSGAAYIFTRSGITWSQQAYLKASNTDGGDGFGEHVAIDGDTVLIGAPYEDSNGSSQSDDSVSNAGAAYVFTRSGVTWSQQAYVKSPNPDLVDYFGVGIDISGDTAVVSAKNEDSNATGVNGNSADNTVTDSGAAFVFTRSGVTWSQQAYLKASNTESNDWFGQSVGIDGDTIVVGAPGEDSNGAGQADNSVTSAGAAYVFTRSGITWSQQAYLKAANTTFGDSQGDGFGVAVAISGDSALVSAPGEDGNATGINGDQTNNTALNSGAGYLFTRSGVTWTQQQYLKASNTSPGDDFSQTQIGIDGDTVILGAWLEDSNATGVDGDGSNNLAGNAGAAYIFAPTAASFIVTKTADTNDGVCDADCSLREAITAANAAVSNDTITFALNGAFTVTSSLPSIANNGTLTITGNGTANTIIQANAAADTAAYRIFSVATSSNLTLDNVTVQNGGNGSTPTLGACIFVNGGGGTLMVQNSSVQNCYAGNSGGGIYANTGSNITLTNSTISGNKTVFNGAGVYCSTCSLTITGTTISNNVVNQSFAVNGAAGVYCNSCTLSVTGSTFSNNSASNPGGPSYGAAMTIEQPGTYTISNSTFTGNSVTSSSSAAYGGALALVGGSPVVSISNSLFSGNTSGSFGGAISIDTGTINLSGSRIISNSATVNGSAIYNEATTGVSTIRNSCITSNSATAIFDSSDAGTIDATGGGNVANSNWWGTNWGPHITAAGGGSALSNGDTINGNGDTVSGNILVDVNLSSTGNPPTGEWQTSAPTVAGALCEEFPAPVTYTVTFDKDGGTGTTNPITGVANNATVTLPSAPTKAGNTFGGWYTALNGGGTQFTASTPVTADITVYAKWTADSQTLTFNSNGGTAVTAITQNFGTAVSAPTNPTRAGYTFAGWFNDDGTFLSAYTFSTMGLSTTIHAKWTAGTYTVTFDKDGGTGTTNPITGVAYNATVTLPSAPTKAGNTFGGWYTALNGGGTQFTAATPVTADITVYAKWTADVVLTPIFVDVPYVHWANNYIERLYQAGITSGCTTTPLNYCPDNEVTRAQMAVFLLKGIHGPAYTPPAATGLIFGDVPLSYWASAFIERFYAEGITSGCTTSPLNFCPDQTATTRAQMAVFLLRARYGASYNPPAASGVFSDVPTSYWAAAWIEQLAAEGITSGCGGGNYCPESPLTRAQMAVFLVKTFNLP